MALSSGPTRRFIAAAATLVGGGTLFTTLNSREANVNDDIETNDRSNTGRNNNIFDSLTIMHINKELPRHVAIVSTAKTSYCEKNQEATTMKKSSESEIYKQCIEYHKSQIDDYRHRWDWNNPSSRIPTTSGFPRNIPSDEEISSLEQDSRFCERSPNFRNDETYCDNLKFRIATYYLTQIGYHDDDDDDKKANVEALQKRGFKLIKDLAETGHGDAMCMYGIVLNDGRVPGTDANPQMAVVWWRRCVDMHRHVPAMYELAVALYTGEGVVENEEMAFQYFRKAANTGHAPAAFMLGDCLLDGIGCKRDRAEALDWLVTAAELGHRGARSRVLAVLERDENTDYGKFTDASRQTLKLSLNKGTLESGDDEDDIVHSDDEASKWKDIDDFDDDDEDRESRRIPVSIERRFTIGGGSGNPVILERRRTVVKESRKEN